jgi:divinyl protochlorophyllide a 8-vinyl-reductase
MPTTEQASTHASTQASGHARMGPNAIIQTVHALRDHYGTTIANTMLAHHEHAHLVEELPSEMIDEADFHRLVQMLVVQTGSSETGVVLREAGQRTAHYLLQHRIPRLFQRLVRILPCRMGMWLLLWAISKHAWTFAGSGQFRFVVDHDPTISLTINYPSVETVAHFYGGTFSVLLQTLINPQIEVQISTSQQEQRLDCIYTLALQQGPMV